MPMKVIFRHSLVTGSWFVLIAGSNILSGNTIVSNRKFEVSFPLNTEKNAVIDLDGTNGVKYVAVLRVNGLEHPENRKKIDLDLGESLATLITINKYRLEVQEDVVPAVTTWYQPPSSSSSQHVVWYQLVVKTSSGQEVTIERRYSEFDLLDQLVRSQTSGHLAAR